MNQILTTVGFFAVMMLVMAVGVLFGRRPLQGSCGGVGSECACLEAGTPDACKVALSESDEGDEGGEGGEG